MRIFEVQSLLMREIFLFFVFFNEEWSCEQVENNNRFQDMMVEQSVNVKLTIAHQLLTHNLPIG